MLRESFHTLFFAHMEDQTFLYHMLHLYIHTSKDIEVHTYSRLNSEIHSSKRWPESTWILESNIILPCECKKQKKNQPLLMETLELTPKLRRESSF